MNPTSKHIAVKSHWFRNHVGKLFLIQKTDSNNQKADIFTKGLQVIFLSGLGNFYAVGKPSDERECRNKWNLQP